MWWVWWPLCCARKKQYGLCSVPPVRGNQRRMYSLHRGHGLLDSSSCGGGDQAGRASLPPVPAHLPTGGSGLHGFAGAWSWCCGPWTPALPGCRGFASAFSSQRARGCSWSHFASVWLLYKLFKGNGIKSLIDCNRFLAVYCFSKSMTNHWKICKLLDPQDFRTSAWMLLQVNSAFVPVPSHSPRTTDCDTWSKSPLIPWNKSLLSWTLSLYKHLGGKANLWLAGTAAGSI